MREQDWTIKERGGHCSACETPFADGQEVASLLVGTEEGYHRLDRCSGCREAPYDGACVSSWTGTFKAPPPPQAEPLRKETAESLLRRLLEQEDPDQRDVLFVLAVMLERRRVFAEKEVQHLEGAKVRVYEHRVTGEGFVIPDPELKLAELEEVQEKVIRLLEGAEPQALPVPEPAPAGEATSTESPS